MARALVYLERQSDTSWKPTCVFLGTPTRVDARALPGDSRRDAWLAAQLAQRSLPIGADGADGDWEDWIGRAVSMFANGHDSWAIEVEPEVTVERLFTREVLGAKPRTMAPPNLRPSDVPPEDLGGYKKVRPA